MKEIKKVFSKVAKALEPDPRKWFDLNDIKFILVSAVMVFLIWATVSMLILVFG